MNQTLRFCLLGLIIGLSGALLYPSLKGHFSAAPAALAPQPEPAIPEGGVVSDAFSLQLFHAALEQQRAQGSVVVTPYIISEWLKTMGEVTAGEGKAQIEALQLPANETPTQPYMELGARLTADDGLHFTPDADAAMRVPFRRDYPFAAALVNGFTYETLSTPPPAPFDLISRETRIVGSIATGLYAPWLRPFRKVDTKKDDFNNANGGMPRVDMMRSRKSFRTAEAEDGSWRAAALFMAPRHGRTCHLALTVIMPQGDARDFARHLTPERLSAIREALIQAPLADTTVTLPRLSIMPVAADISPLLQQMGVTAPFDIRKADFSPLFSDKIALNGVIQYTSLHFTDSDEQGAADTSIDEESRNAFRVNRPFLWVLGNIDSADAPFAMGLVENL